MNKLVGRSIVIVVLSIVVLAIGATAVLAYLSSTQSGQVLAAEVREPLNGATAAAFDIDVGMGNLAIDTLSGGETMLATGALEYLERQGPPTQSVDMSNGRATLTVKSQGMGKPTFRLPWAACNQAFAWSLHLNRDVRAELTARSGGGNIKLHLEGMKLSRLSAQTGGGNVEVTLPDGGSDVAVVLRTGAGNVNVSVPEDAAVRVRATSGLGKVIVDPQWIKMDDQTYQSPDYEGAASKYDITAQSGAGNVVISDR